MNGAVIVETRPDIDVGSVIDKHRIFLPGWDIVHIHDVAINNTGDYNILLTSAEFWEKLPFEKILIFQWDSGILREGIDEFLEWDYIGSPWAWRVDGGNGGFSLRSRDMMLRVIGAVPYSSRHDINEDIYFCNHIASVGGKLAPRGVCETFSMEEVYKLGTLGYHAIDKYHSEEKVKIILNQYAHLGNT